jgi:hypothetical protein
MHTEENPRARKASKISRSSTAAAAAAAAAASNGHHSDTSAHSNATDVNGQDGGLTDDNEEPLPRRGMMKHYKLQQQSFGGYRGDEFDNNNDANNSGSGFPGEHHNPRAQFYQSGRDDSIRLPDEITVPLNGSPPPPPGLQAGNSFMNSLSAGEWFYSALHYSSSSSAIRVNCLMSSVTHSA